MYKVYYYINCYRSLNFIRKERPKEKEFIAKFPDCGDEIVQACKDGKGVSFNTMGCSIHSTNFQLIQGKYRGLLKESLVKLFATIISFAICIGATTTIINNCSCTHIENNTFIAK